MFVTASAKTDASQPRTATQRKKVSQLVAWELSQIDVNLTKVTTVSELVKPWKMQNINRTFGDWKDLSTSQSKAPQQIFSAGLSLTSSDDFLFGDVVWVDFSGKLQDCYVGVLVCMWIHVGQRLQLFWEPKKDKCRLVSKSLYQLNKVRQRDFF